MQPRWRLLATFFLSVLIHSPVGSSREMGVPVAVANAQTQGILEVVQLNGSVTARRNAQLSVVTAGLVTRLDLEEGDYVEAGEVLLQMDEELARQQYQAAHAVETEASHALDDARRRLAEAQELVPNQSIAKTLVKDIAAEVAQDKAVLERAQAETGYREGLLTGYKQSNPGGAPGGGELQRR